MEHHADACAVLIDIDVALEDVLTVNQDLAGIGNLKQINTTQQRRFTASRRTDHRDDIALIDMKLNIIEHLKPSEVLAEVFDFNKMLHHTYSFRD